MVCEEERKRGFSCEKNHLIENFKQIIGKIGSIKCPKKDIHCTKKILDIYVNIETTEECHLRSNHYIVNLGLF